MNNHSSITPQGQVNAAKSLRDQALELAAKGYAMLPATFKKAPAADTGGWNNASSDPQAVASMQWDANAGRMGIRLGEYRLSDGRVVHLFGFDLDPPKRVTMNDADWASHPLGQVFFGLLAELRGRCIVGRTPRGWRLFVLMDGATVRATGSKALGTDDGAKLEFLSKGGALVAGTIFYDRDGKEVPETSPAAVQRGTYQTLEGGDLRLDQLAVVPASRLERLRADFAEANKANNRPAQPAQMAPATPPSPSLDGQAMPTGTTGRPADGQVGFSGGQPLVGRGVAPAAPAQSPPAHIAGGPPVRNMAAVRKSDPAEVRDAMLHKIAADKAAGEDTGDRDYWLNTVKLPLAGDIATGRLTEDEARPIFVAASEACGGAVDSETDWQKFIASDVPNAQALGQAGKRPKTTASVFKDAQAAGWVSPVTPQGDGHGGVQQGAGRKPGVSVPELIDQLAGQPLAFGRNERTGKHTFDLTQPIPGVALPVGVRQIVDDTAGRQIAALLARMTGRDIGVPKAMDAMKTEGDAHPYDPVKEALGALVKNNPWDGTPRLDTWLVTYLGALDTPLHRSWGRLTVLALIARILKPGCKWDHVLTLCGAQGAGKSTLGEIMADLFGPDLFTPMTVLGTDDQKVMEATGGKLVVELSDMSRGRIREVENDKALLSRTFDEARMAYGREVTKQRRGFIFIATTNDDQFLQDVTGNRRWWPVKVGAINLEAFRNDWPQIVVEALQVFFGPEFGGDVTKIGLDPKFYGDAAAAQKAFTSPDELAADVETMLRQKAPDGSWGVRRSTVGGGLRVSHGDLRNRLAGGVWGRLGPNKLGKELNRVMRALGWTAAKAQGDRQWIQPATW